MSRKLHPGALAFTVLLMAGLFAFGSPALAQNCQTFSGLTYGTYVDGSGATQNLLLDLMVPAGVATPVPLVIWVHGGGWSSGSRLPIPSNVTALCDRGFAVASLDYRFTNVARWPAQIQDCRGAVRWLRANAAAYGIDPDRFGVWGPSAGGELASMLGTAGGVATETLGSAQVDLEGAVGGNPGVSSRVQAVVDWYGAIDFLQMRFFPTPSAPNHDGATSAESKLIGGPIQDNPELSATASPLTYITPDDPPFLIMHGTQDTLYPFHQSRLLADALAAQGVPVTFTPVPNAGHGGSGWNPAWVSQAVWDFFAAKLQNLPAQTVAVTPPSSNAFEAGANPRSFTITRTSSTAAPLTVRYAWAGTAARGPDYTASPAGSVTIPAGAASAAVTVTPVDDSLVEGTETIILNLANDPAYRIDAAHAAASLDLDDDETGAGLPAVSIQATDAKAAEAGLDPGQLTVSLDAPAAANLTVAYSIGGTATPGSDYTALPGTVTIPAGQTAATITVAPLADGLLETGESVIVTLKPSAAYRLGSSTQASVAIADQDFDPNVPIVSAIATDFTAAEPGVAPDPGEFTLTRTGSTAAALTVSLTPGGTATNGTDYTALPANVTFGAGVSRLTVALTPADDLLTEGTETASLTVAPQAGIDLGRFDGNSVAISDDEPLLGSLALTGLTVSPAALAGGGQATGTVTLNAPAPSSGVTVSLASSDPVATVPASLVVPAGASTATFKITTQVVTAEKPVTISASFRTVTKTAGLTVQAPVLSSLTLTPGTFIGGCATSTGKVSLTGKAPTGGIAVTLTNGNPAAAMPASVTVAAGATSASFTITAPAVTANQTGTVTATQGSITKSATLTVRPVGLASLNLSPNPATGGTSVTGTVTLECTATPGPITVTLSTTSTVAQPDVSTLAIPAGSTTGTFNITTATVTAQSKATIKAAANGTSKSVTLTVNP